MNTIALDNIRRDRTALIAELENAGAKIRGNTVFCPFHQDHRASGGIYQGKDDGAWRYKCLACGAGGDVFDIRAKAASISVAEAIKEIAGQSCAKPNKYKQTGSVPVQAFANLQQVRDYLQSKVGSLVSEHSYIGITGDTVQIVFRCQSTTDGKTYRPAHLTDKGYCLSFAPKPWPLYNLLDVIKAETVIVVEGEKCVETLKLYGFTGTTSAGGAKNAKNTDWTPLAGKAVVLWPDNDPEGKRYMLDVQQILETLQPAPRISVLDPASLDLAEKEDVADFVGQLEVLQKSDTEITAALAEVLKKAVPVSIATEVQERFAQIKIGRYCAIDWPWESVSRLTRALLPGTVTLLVGNPGASKSFMALQAFSFWNEQGLRTSLYEIEEDRTFHLTRALAQKTRQGDITDPQWVKENPEQAERIVADNREFLDNFGRVLYASPDVQPTLAQLSQWIEQQAKTGCRIIGIDPITSAERGGEPWIVDNKFLQAIKKTATDYRLSIILITHPIKSVSFPDLSQVAGSAAYQRFAQTILWLESHEEKSSKVKTAVGRTEMTYNRTLHILKARNGKGMGLKLAFDFDSETLRLNELGLVVKEREKTE
jgi:hypothetical protein